ncbi:MAG: MATE family efflux transporter [Defluviitaleaceae bacterium]|nr:MATE family efflux transporter [Defluviitaleaceae bacterium]
MTKKYDLTNGRILDKLLLVSMPIMGMQLLGMAYNLTDMFWLGRLPNGEDAVAASGSAGMFIWLSMAFMIIGRMGAEIGVSQNMGKGDEESAKKFSQNAIFLAAALGLFCGLTAIFFSPALISVFSIPEAHVAADAAAYLAIVGFGMPAMFIAWAIGGTFNGSGNSRLPFIASSIGFIINMILSPILIFQFDMGIIGAATATPIAQWVALIIMLVAVKKSKGRPFSEYRFFVKPEKEKILSIVKWCLPIALESMFFTILSMSVTRIVAGGFGSDAVAVMRVGGQIESLSWLIGGGFGTAVTAFVGQNYGAGKWSRIHKGFKISFTTMFVWGVLVTGILYFGGTFLFSIFLQEPELVRIGAEYLKILAMCQITGSVESIAAGAFRGTGKTIPPSLSSITCNALRVPLAFALSRTELGLNGVWIGMTIGAFARGVVVFAWYLIYARKQPRFDLK